MPPTPPLTPPPLPADLRADLPSAAAVAALAWQKGLAPDPVRTTDQWADAERRVAAESGSPWPGPWITDRAPYLREPMRCMSLAHPSRRVTMPKSAQTGGSECALNLLGQIMAETPCPVLVMLPSHNEAQDYNKLKLQPMIDATPAVRRRVRDITSRDETGSTINFKKFPGGYLQIVGANSSKNLQMRTARVLVNDEVSEFPFDVDGRGDPLALAEERLTGFTGREKIVDISTPGLEGTCRVTKLYETSSGGRYTVPCPHCDTFQPLEFANLRYTEADPADAAYACAACGTLIEHHHKHRMIAAGEWRHDRPELLETHAGFHINALYSPFLNWADVARKYLTARKTGQMKVFTQQSLGLAYKESGEAPDHTRLHERRDRGRQLRRLPPEALWITGAADVQGDRVEWDVYAWGPGMSAWLIDTGIIASPPTDDATWRELTKITERHYEDSNGRAWKIDAFGCDTGYMSQQVYRWAITAPRTEAIFALDGKGRPALPALGTASKLDVDFQGRKIGAVKLWPVGTHSLKLAHYAAIRRTLNGPVEGEMPRGALYLPETVDEAYCRQLTAEYLHTDAKTAKKEWRVITGTRNERLDTAVYARALAHHLTDSLTPADWQRLAATRATNPAAAQADLAAYWNERFGTTTETPPAPPPAPVPPTPAAAPPPAFIPRPRAGWLRPGRGYL